MSRRTGRRIAATFSLSLASCALIAGGAQAAALAAHGQLLQLGHGWKLNANQSSNWFGYNQGTLEQGSKLFNSITGDWTVPTASQHTAGHGGGYRGTVRALSCVC